MITSYDYHCPHFLDEEVEAQRLKNLGDGRQESKKKAHFQIALGNFALRERRLWE